MSKVLEGQLSLLDLLAPEPAPAAVVADPFIPDPTNPWASHMLHNPCPGCGSEDEYNHWTMPEWKYAFDHEVCISMDLTLNHVHHGLARAGKKWDEVTPCCYDKGGLHGKAVKKPTREQWLDHARFDIERAKVKWKLHLPSLIKAVGEVREKYGVTPDEAPVIEESLFTVSESYPGKKSPCGYCGKVAGIGGGDGGVNGHIPDGRHCVARICAECIDKHGCPDLATYTNLKVIP